MDVSVKVFNRNGIGKETSGHGSADLRADGRAVRLMGRPFVEWPASSVLAAFFKQANPSKRHLSSRR